jgi:predicted tellurium resistance membrane protein TerC
VLRGLALAFKFRAVLEFLVLSLVSLVSLVLVVFLAFLAFLAPVNCITAFGS